ncbi:hypothetical protein EYF80_009876 [Liparis tanakae]|uniref:Uncharacterized protein n=1 Tax=Liparis tanakae TaxID=230148 RepID=A0A4Z2IP94_9TELE|nr:hypothetical protein EYF80_009876 [Liparis tanakae]
MCSINATSTGKEAGKHRRLRAQRLLLRLQPHDAFLQTRFLEHTHITADAHNEAATGRNEVNGEHQAAAVGVTRLDGSDVGVASFDNIETEEEQETCAPSDSTDAFSKFRFQKAGRLWNSSMARRTSNLRAMRNLTANSLESDDTPC